MFDHHVVKYNTLRYEWLRTTYIMPWREFLNLYFGTAHTS